VRANFELLARVLVDEWRAHYSIFVDLGWQGHGP
jgi:hypothetical protein